ncbi:hypothetical protein [Xanthomonas campestris]|uniref:hypothetical protein n=1 Tax=Xanthomonas campestris TaxID=339 RepID=UPI000E1E6C83|nr:hypothetical protein [Xanthomonas campestris]
MHALLITAAAALLGAAIPAAAGETSHYGRTIQLCEETSTIGESLDAFVSRIAPRARATSISARAIVCGEILGNGPYSLTLKTDGYTDDCRVPKTAAPYVLVNGIAREAREDHFTITHHFRPGYLITPWSIKFQDRAGVRKVGAAGR